MVIPDFGYQSYVSKATHRQYKAAWVAAGKPDVSQGRKGPKYMPWAKHNSVPLHILSMSEWKAPAVPAPAVPVPAVAAAPVAVLMFVWAF